MIKSIARIRRSWKTVILCYMMKIALNRKVKGRNAINPVRRAIDLVRGNGR